MERSMVQELREGGPPEATGFAGYQVLTHLSANLRGRQGLSSNPPAPWRLPKKNQGNFANDLPPSSQLG